MDHEKCPHLAVTTATEFNKETTASLFTVHNTDVFSGPSIFNNNVECILYFLACHVSISHWVPTIFIKRTPMEFLLHKTYLKSCLVLYFPTVNSLSTITISLFRLFASVVVASVFFRHASLRAKYTRLSIRFASLFDQ